MSSTFKTFISALAVLTMVCSTHVSQAGIVIDDFSFGNALIRTTVGTSTQVSMDGSILGGERTDSVTLNSSGLGVIQFGDSFSTTQGASNQINVSLLYDDLGTIDLTEGGLANEFTIAVGTSDTPEDLADVLSLVVTGGGVTEEVGAIIPGADNSTIRISFGEFSSVDLTQIDSIELLLDFQNPDTTGRDVIFLSFATSVPEPSGGVIFGLLMFGTAISRRRRS